MKKIKIMFWLATGLIFLMEGLLPALTFKSEMARQAFIHLGYPSYFFVMLTIFKVLGGLALIVPIIPKQIKELAYAGYTFDFTCAFISLWAVDGFSGQLLLPVIALAILIVSYLNFQKLNLAVIAQ